MPTQPTMLLTPPWLLGSLQRLMALLLLVHGQVAIQGIVLTHSLVHRQSPLRVRAHQQRTWPESLWRASAASSCSICATGWRVWLEGPDQTS